MRQGFRLCNPQQAEKLFTVSLSESELVLLIGQLWQCEHEQTMLAHAAKMEGRHPARESSKGLPAKGLGIGRQTRGSRRRTMDPTTINVAYRELLKASAN